jgi:hypothetical protein
MMRCIDSRKGQEAKFLTGIPVLLLILACVGIFLGFSFSLAAIKGEKSITSEHLHAINDEAGILYEPLFVAGKPMLVLDAVLSADAGKLGHAEVEKALGALLAAAPDGSCLLLALDGKPEPGGKPGGAARNDFYLVKEQGVVRGANFGAYPVLFAPYRRADALRAISFDVVGEGRIYFEYYRGRCVS